MLLAILTIMGKAHGAHSVPFSFIRKTVYRSDVNYCGVGKKVADVIEFRERSDVNHSVREWICDVVPFKARTRNCEFDGL